LYGIEGSAFATLLTVAIYNTIKLIYVVKKMNLFPFTVKTLYSLGILVTCFGLFYFWDFPFYTIINIALKSILIAVFYLFVNYKLEISEEFNNVVKTFLKKARLL
jgi:hypothetical protein